jgi:hypothetical protein
LDKNINKQDQITEFELMLKSKEENNHIVTNSLQEFHQSTTLKSDKTATLSDFINMLCMLINKSESMKKLKAIFLPDEGARIRIDQKETIDNSYIFFDLISRTPLNELKPRHREDILEITDDINNKRAGYIFGQKYSTIIQFNILACDYKTANAVINNLEDLLFKYTGYFKKNGISEILFKNQYTDQNLAYYRQSLSVRSLVYEIITEKLFVQFKSEIQNIHTS